MKHLVILFSLAPNVACQALGLYLSSHCHCCRFRRHRSPEVTPHTSPFPLVSGKLSGAAPTVKGKAGAMLESGYFYPPIAKGASQTLHRPVPSAPALLNLLALLRKEEAGRK